MPDFNKPIFDNARNSILVCAHRGISGGNIPCNTIPAFNAALSQGADIVELDVSESRDGDLFVFHPGMESHHLGSVRAIPLHSSKSVSKMKYRNFDGVKTHYTVEKFEDVLLFLKGKCYINIDKFWTNIPAITSMIRKCGVENQVIVKTPIKEKHIKLIEKYAPDLMFMPMVKGEDNITDELLKRNLNYIGTEILFKNEDDPIASKEYISSMHDKKLLIFANSIVYNEMSIISAGLTDDRAIGGDPDGSWGKLIDMNVDIIQTDWCADLKKYIKLRSFKNDM